MLIALECEPWEGQRTSTRKPLVSKVFKALSASEHDFSVCAGRWICWRCRVLVPRRHFVKVASTPCSRPVPSVGVLDAASGKLAVGCPAPSLVGGDQFTRLSGEVRIGVHKLHESHTLHLWAAYVLRFRDFVRPVASRPRPMAAAITYVCSGKAIKKGHEILLRICKLEFPSHGGPPAAVRQARTEQFVSSSRVPRVHLEQSESSARPARMWQCSHVDEME